MMEDKLRALGKTMKKAGKQQLQFTSAHKSAVFNEIKKENTLAHTLQLLTEARTGVELMGLLRSRGITKFDHQEGFLYTMLHQLEKEGFLASSWNEEEQKYYRLTSKGAKTLQAMEKNTSTVSLTLQALLGGAR
ncbi:PadR family transcriptional regulator [Bacillus sp. 1P06AnD]|uniref:PadR family transcriptional regulator n=1 Tax=Bacillus sp. 1P06AnD TaxID=3132208 RepID=UPI0039A1EB07